MLKVLVTQRSTTCPRAHDVKNRVVRNSCEAKCFRAKVFNAELIDVQAGLLKSIDEIAFAILAHMVTHAKVLPAQRVRIEIRILMKSRRYRRRGARGGPRSRLA